MTFVKIIEHRHDDTVTWKERQQPVTATAQGLRLGDTVFPAPLLPVVG